MKLNRVQTAVFVDVMDRVFCGIDEDADFYQMLRQTVNDFCCFLRSI